MIVFVGFVFMLVSTWSFFEPGYSLTWRIVGLSLSAFFGLGVVDLMTAYVTLGRDDIVVRDSFRTRRIAFAEVTNVVRESGASISLQLADGTWYKLPSWCESGVGMSNRIRARIRPPP